MLNNFSNLHPSNAKYLGERTVAAFSGSVHFANFPNVLNRQLCATAAPNIFKVRNRLKVFRVYAKFVLTGVVKDQSFRNRTVDEGVIQNVGLPASTASASASIPFMLRPLPYPAPAAFIHLVIRAICSRSTTAIVTISKINLSIAPIAASGFALARKCCRQSAAALAKALLDGRVINIKNGFHLLGITNVPREIGRCIEDEKRNGFGVIVSRVERKGTSQYGQPVEWTDYRLNFTEYNRPGIEKMKEYVRKEMATINHTTDKQKEQFKALSLF